MPYLDNLAWALLSRMQLDKYLNLFRLHFFMFAEELLPLVRYLLVRSSLHFVSPRVPNYG